MQRPVATMASDVGERVREVESMLLVEGSIWVGGPRAVGVSFLFFSFFFWFKLQSVLL